MSQQVFTAIVTGKPVASANAHEVVIRRSAHGTHGSIKHSDEYKAWFDAAIVQLEKQLVISGHTPIRQLVKSPSGKNARKQITEVINPLFTHEKGMRYRVQVWFAAPEHLYEKDSTGAYVYRKDGKHALKSYKADADGPLKGIKDALEEAGVIDNDFYVDISGPVYRVKIAEGMAPFLVVEVSDASEPLASYVGSIPPAPVWPVGDLSLYMPKVLDGSHGWWVDRTREANFQAYLARHGKVAPIMISKIRCKCCHLLIGSGHVATEIWAHWGQEMWKEQRWPNEVVMICNLCAEERFRERDSGAAQEITDVALQLLRKITEEITPGSAVHITEAPAPGDKLFANYTMARQLAEKKVRQSYRDRYLLVASDEIATVDWTSDNPHNLGIEERRQAKQKEVFHDSAATSSGTNPDTRDDQQSTSPRVSRGHDWHPDRTISRYVHADDGRGRSVRSFERHCLPGGAGRLLTSGDSGD